MKLSVVMPVYNEAKTIREIVAPGASPCRSTKEIVIVDDWLDGRHARHPPASSTARTACA